MNSPHISRHLLIAVLVVATLAVFGNTFRNQWTYDDLPVVLKNPDSHTLAGFLQNSRPGRPLRELSYIPEYQLFGDKPAGYHIQQLFWHGANGVLLLAIFTCLGIEPLWACLAALLFLVHPLQAESVANISHRKELLALFFCLPCFLFYLKGAAKAGGWRWLALGCSLLAFLVALTANETAVTFPLVLVAYELLCRKKGERVLLRRPLLMGLVAAAAGLFILYQFRGLFAPEQFLKIYSKNGFVESRGYLPLYLAAAKAFGFYLYKILLPFRLAPEYVIHFATGIYQPLAWLSLVLFALMIYGMVAFRRRVPLASLGICWFLALYLPVSNLVPVAYIVADRYMYLCLPGIALAVAALLQKRGQAAVVVTGAVLVVFAGLTVIQNGYWRNEHLLWRHAVTVNPDSTWVQETVALSYLLKGELPQARDHARQAIALYRYNTRAYLTLARVEERYGNLDESVRNYELFQSFGWMEYPEEAAEVRSYLPILRERAQILHRQGKE